jgi:hypothetical protein
VEELEARASSGRAGPRGDTTGHTIGAGPVGRYYKVLAGCFVTGSFVFGRFVLGVLFLDPRS